MISFKKWLQLELLAGPGGGPEADPESQEKLAREISKKGAGAFLRTGDEPPKVTNTVTKNYEDKRFSKRMMKKV